MKRAFSFLVFWIFLVTQAQTEEALNWGGHVPENVCERSTGEVWSEYEGGADCLRYFVGGNVNEAAVAIVVLHGDRHTWLSKEPTEIPQNTPSEQTAVAQALADSMGYPVILLSRPGTFGSSGDHSQRRQHVEFLALDAALDEIRAMHGIERFALLGHSGGATAGAALLTLGREDIVCAVLTSGAFGLLERAEVLREAAGNAPRPGLDTTGLPNPYDPLDHLESIPEDPDRQIIIIGNPNDRITPFYLQERFYQGLLAHGHGAKLVEAEATPPRFHLLTDNIGREVAKACLEQLE